MALDAATLARVREWVGSNPSDATIETRYNLDGNGTVETTALSILRQRRADLEANPASFDVSGDYKQDTSKNLEMIGERIAELESLSGVGADVLSSGFMVRGDGR